ncbi:MAG TPA: hypothetical protein VGA20_06910 [Gemmatimonadales bacterium]
MGTSRHLLRAATILILSTCTLSAQQPGFAPGREFTLVQRSYWLSDGIDPTAPSPAETTLALIPDSARSAPTAVARLKPTDWRPAIEIRGDSRARLQAVVVLTDSASAADSVAAREYGSLPLTLASWWSVARRARASAWRDTLEYTGSAASDTIVVRWVRAARRLDARRSRRGGWARIGSATLLSIDGWTTIERDLEPPGVRVRTTLSGPLREEMLYDTTTGQLDSVHVRGTLVGRRVFVHPDGRTDTVSGRWVIAQDACWFSPPDSAAAVWIGDAGYVDAHCPAPGEGPRTFWPLAARVARGDTVALDTLFALRRGEATPLRRASARFLDADGADHAPFVRRAIAAYRPGDPELLSRLIWRAALDVRGIRDDTAFAAFVTRELGDLKRQRVRAIDRADVLPTLWSGLMRGAPVSHAVAEIFAAAAAGTDDFRARDVFLLAAYRAAPARYAALVSQLADRRGWVWRFARGAIPPQDTTSFPGLATPWRAHARYVENVTWEEKLGALRSWFAARRLDPVSALRNQYAAEADTVGRFVWADYLLALGDTTPAAWLVATAEAERRQPVIRTWPGFPGDSVASGAFELLWKYRDVAADTVRDLATLTEVQAHVLACDRPARTDSAPAFLLARSVTDEAQDLCGQRYRLMTGDSLQRLADQESRIWATVVSPLLRIGRRYVIDVEGHYWTRRNESCLCGHGHRYLLTHRNGEWRSVLIDSWMN